MDRCAACGRDLRPGAGFCGGCGARVTGEADHTAVTSVPSSPPMPPEPPAQTPPQVAYAARAPYAPAGPQATAVPPVYGPPSYGPQPYGMVGAAPPGTSLAALCQAGQLMSWNGRPLSPAFANRKVAAGILGIFFGQFGVHKFVLGYVGSGIAMLLITLVSIPLSLILIGFVGLAAMSIIGLIEGILYLTRSDEEFIQRYGVNHKSWF